MLLYTSRRTIGSGLLGVRPLSENQVAEYRFWRPCGRRTCAIGCGRAHAGEWAAAKRLFREAEDVETWGEAVCEDGGDAHDHLEKGFEKGVCKADVVQPSTWAGQQMVTNWGQFLMGCEREGVADV